MRVVTNARTDAMAIGELSKLTGVHVETIRYYERIKMLPKPPRTAGGRRTYGATHVRVLTFIKRSRELGFSPDDVRTLLRLGGPDKARCCDVRDIATATSTTFASGSPIYASWSGCWQRQLPDALAQPHLGARFWIFSMFKEANPRRLPKVSPTSPAMAEEFKSDRLFAGAGLTTPKRRVSIIV